ncbi:hypothetical protein Fcan01_28409 [Folsomia candida]|uniref:DUF7779 domain-containing protein n=1 Tax=Folsomia candida TaxID=158441 RepID=A0A226CWD2_FOLCA|nr:hypothetical protein Fcan01_28409 [Folsomia candida]
MTTTVFEEAHWVKLRYLLDGCVKFVQGIMSDKKNKWEITTKQNIFNILPNNKKWTQQELHVLNQRDIDKWDITLCFRVIHLPPAIWDSWGVPFIFTASEQEGIKCIKDIRNMMNHHGRDEYITECEFESSCTKAAEKLKLLSIIPEDIDSLIREARLQVHIKQLLRILCAPPQSGNFAGRVTEAKTLLKFLDNQSQRALVICGLAGMGKTELIKNLIYHSCQEDGITILWLHGETFDSLRDSFLKIAGQLSISYLDKDEPINIWCKVLNVPIICGARKLLVVIDNAEGHELFNNATRKISELSNAKLIVTSTNRDICGGESEILSLDVFEIEDAMKFVITHLAWDRLQAETLCIRLGCYPLALQQAIAYIKHQRNISLEGDSYNISNFLAVFDIQPQDLLDTTLNQSQYGKSALKTISMSITSLHVSSGENAILLLQLISLMKPDEIAVDFLLTRMSNLFEISLDDIEDGLRMLKTHSLIISSNRVLTIHRLVQDVTRYLMKSEYEQHIRRILTNLVIKGWSRSEIGHAVQIWKHAANMDSVVRDHSAFPVKLVGRLLKLSLFNEAYEFALLNVDILKHSLGENNRDTLRMERELATSIGWMDRTEAATMILEKLLEKSTTVFGIEDEDTLRIAHQLAIYIPDDLDAIQRNKYILEIRQRKYSEDLKSIYISKHNLGLRNIFAGNFEQAMEILKEVYEWRCSRYGSSYSETLRTKHAVGLCLYYENDYANAKETFEDVLQSRNQVLGEEHFDTIRTRRVLAFVLREMGLNNYLHYYSHPRTVVVANSIPPPNTICKAFQVGFDIIPEPPQSSLVLWELKAVVVNCDILVGIHKNISDEPHFCAELETMDHPNPQEDVMPEIHRQCSEGITFPAELHQNVVSLGSVRRFGKDGETQEERGKDGKHFRRIAMHRLEFTEDDEIEEGRRIEKMWK